MTPIAYQGMVYAIRTKNVSAESTYKDFETLEFNIKLPEMNKNLHIRKFGEHTYMLSNSNKI